MNHVNVEIADRMLGLAVITNGHLKRADGIHNLLVALPTDLHGRIMKTCNGSAAVSIVGLLQHALDELEDGNKTLVVKCSQS